MIGKAFGQVHFMPGSQESTANVWNVRIPGNPSGMTYGEYGVPGGRMSVCMKEWYALQRHYKKRKGSRGGRRLDRLTLPPLPPAWWIERCKERQKALGYSGGGYGDGDAMDGAIVDQRPLAMLRKPHTMAGVTLPMWGWALGGIFLYRIACR